MISNGQRGGRGAFTLFEILVTTGVSSIIMVAVITTWTVLQAHALNVRRHAERQSDQMRVVDYLKRDIRRATTVEIYNGGTQVTGTAFGSELRLTIPDYYTDTREEDNALGSSTRRTPTLTAGKVAYGTALTVRYYVLNGAVIREEADTARALSDRAGAFTTSFRKETTGEVRCRVIFNQTLRGGVPRTLHRQVDVLSGQRTQLRS